MAQATARMERCTLYVSVDTGLMHMAATLRKHVVELSIAWSGCVKNNGAHPCRRGPWGAEHYFAFRKASRALHRDLPRGIFALYKTDSRQ